MEHTRSSFNISRRFLVFGFIVALILASGTAAQAQNLQWAKQAGGTGTSLDGGTSIAVDGAGNSYVTGFFDGTATFGAGEANETAPPSAGATDIFVAKYDPNDALIWAKWAGGADFDRGAGIAGDGSGDNYVTGYFTGAATFGAGESNEVKLTSQENIDIFVAKYDSSGTLVWARRAGGTSIDDSEGIAVDNSGNSYVTGGFAHSATFGLGEGNQTTLVSTSAVANIFVAKLAGAFSARPSHCKLL